MRHFLSSDKGKVTAKPSSSLHARCCSPSRRTPSRAAALPFAAAPPLALTPSLVLTPPSLRTLTSPPFRYPASIRRCSRAPPSRPLSVCSFTSRPLRCCANLRLVRDSPGSHLRNLKHWNTKNWMKDVVGSRIKVWWPVDKKFYHGVVESFNPASKQHEVVYDDGDIEHLALKDERWEFIEDDNEAPAEGEMEENITHFAHPPHPLGKVQSPESFTCDGCKTEGSGHMYWCESCDFKLHTFCTTGPANMALFLHPEHRVSLVNVNSTHRCDVCNEQLLAMSYRCALCDFDAHPACALLPPTVKDEVHPEHVLTFIDSNRRPCTGCGSECSGGRYRCDLCQVDYHPKCLRRDVLGRET